MAGRQSGVDWRGGRGPGVGSHRNEASAARCACRCGGEGRGKAPRELREEQAGRGRRGTVRGGSQCGVGTERRASLDRSCIFPASGDKTRAELVSPKTQLLAHQSPKAGRGWSLVTF